MLDMKTMSKQKYIYYVYESDKTLHIEKFPIIYINSEFVYFKTGRKNALENVRTSRVKDNLEDIFKHDYHFVWREDRYFWNSVENPEEVVAELKRKADEKRIAENKSWAERELENAKKAYERAQEKYKIWQEVEAKKGVKA